ncbi:hypothetical protein [Beggiatoa leptomitoformis]|uniref:Glycosyltransferase RgtA/B/C/D-like domain-containing protein n=1 Tax=Beggiatoa leptomitoformis TaxID=288004 RepID=A0A2N9YFH4_9GAMM|nr:hypothetical protein [Beggiatoa leptomitoformis]ALG68392.1 hypothetical protein AL038_12635 [Beggiatoa leptomitoformis]AUI69281.1 hypothetical protein BLE401_11630 [Beggiatoa leptomitoformis]
MQYTSFISKNGKILIIIFVLISIFTVRILYSNTPYTNHPDEEIVLGIVNNMIENNEFDTNWKHAPLSPAFQYDQYNFSAYHYASYLFFTAIKFLATTFSFTLSNIEIHRLFSALLGLWAGVVLAWIAWKQLGSFRVTFIVLLLYLVAPLLIQDSHYARAESFMTFLSLLVLSFSLQEKNIRYTLASGFIIGILTACKFIMLLMLVLPILQILRHEKTLKSFSLSHLIIIVFACLMGIFIGMPYAFFHIEAYLNGVQYLQNQYATPIPPYGVIEGKSTAFVILTYFYTTFGLAIWLTAVMGIYKLFTTKNSYLLTVLITPVLLFFTLFSLQLVFFERSFSHLVPFVLLLSAIGTDFVINLLQDYTQNKILILTGTISLLVLLLFIPATITYRLLFIEMSGARKQAIAPLEQYLLTQYATLDKLSLLLIDSNSLQTIAQVMATKPIILLRVEDFLDDFTAKNLKQLQRDYTVETIGKAESSFPDIISCSLHTYHSPRIHYLLVSKH